MRSNRARAVRPEAPSGANKSPSKNPTFTAPSRSALSCASESAPGEISTASTRVVGRSRPSEIATHPDPVHKSSTRADSDTCLVRASAVSTRISVSGRGTSTRASTRNGRP